MKNIFVKTALVLAAALISFGASADTTKREKRTDGVIARTFEMAGAPAKQVFTPSETEKVSVTMPMAQTLEIADFATKAAERSVVKGFSKSASGIQATADPIKATAYTIFTQPKIGLVCVVSTSGFDYQFVFKAGITEIELGKTYTYADMQSDYTGLVQGEKMYAVTDASFLMTKAEDLVRIECSAVNGGKTYTAVYQEIPVPTPTKTVTLEIPSSDYGSDDATWFQFYGYTADNAYFATFSPDMVFKAGQFDVESFDKAYSYIGDVASGTRYTALAIDGPITLTKNGDVLTCHVRMIAENAVLYDVTFTYAPGSGPMKYDEDSDVEIAFQPSEVSVSTNYFAEDGSIYVRLDNGVYRSIVVFFVNPEGEAKIAEGTYAVNDSGEAGTIFASPGVTGSSVYPSFIGLLTDEDSISKVWFLEDGSATVTDDRGQLIVEINALNSYGRNVKISFKYGEKAGSGWGEWKDYDPKGDATGYYYFSGLFEQPGIKSDIPVQIRQDVGNPALAQIKLVGWASDVMVEGEGPDLIIDWNMETNKLRVAPQTTGIHNTYYDEDVLITDIGYAYMESYLPYYPCEYDPELGRFNLNVLYTTQSMLGTGSSFNESLIEYFQMDGYKDYTFDGWLSAFEEDVQAGTAQIAYACYEAGVDVEYGMLYTVTDYKSISSNSRIDPEKVAAVLAQAETSMEWGAVLSLPAPGEYCILAGSLDEDGEYSGNYDVEKYVFVSSKDWKTIGVGEYTDDLVAGYYSVEPITYDVEIQENVNTPGLYRVKNMFGAAYPYNEDPSEYREDTYVYIDATNPNSVTEYKNYPSFIGLNWGDGELQWQASEPGALVDNVITFPTKGLGIFGPDGSGYYANRSGAFRLVIKYDIPLAYEVSGTEAVVVASENVYENELNIPEKATVEGVEYTVSKIGQQAFTAQTAVTAISIPATVNEIGASAFSLCIGVQSITCAATVPPTCGATAFYKINPAATIKVPAESVDAYKAADGWKMFANIEAIPVAE